MSTGTRKPTLSFLNNPIPRISLLADLRHVFRTGLGIAAWCLMSAFVLFAAYVGWLVIIAFVVLREGPSSSNVLPVLVPILALGALLFAVLVARFISSPRKVAATVAVMLAIVWGIQATRAVASPDWARYQARAAAWGESDVNDYQKFPQRAIPNGGTVYAIPVADAPLDARPVEYQSGGRNRQAPDLDTFLKSTKTTSFIIIKDGKVRYETYFNGYSRDSIVTSFSVAKSFMSALTGTAISDGYIGGVDDKVTLYLPELRGKGMDDVTIRHLLTMSSGIHFTGGDETSFWEELTLTDDETLAYYHPDLRSRALGVKRDGLPAGADFKYNNYLPQLLGLILERTTHRPVSEYLAEKIWQPLGAEFPASWSLDSKNGFEQMQSGINARAIDFAKFGQMFLNGGSLNGRQIIPPTWVKESTSPDSDDHRPWDSDRHWSESGGYYKYFWWGMPNPDGTYDYIARGHLGQRIYVSPRNNSVIVRFGINDGGVDNWDAVIASLAGSLR